ncbi:hypothetical protein CFOL_v3_18603 [Cephalotus follicularis]|uniref:Uncharacterized protein n=1 Tax=Cephalotus follicularis TaxID=3775 RepID=A0A1Q3C4F4_CEPFO|nr:hypothetical protein CFOL_v3_18603 [Cephalotus follicularis]
MRGGLSGWSRQRKVRRCSKSKIAKDEKTNTPRERSHMEHMLKHPSQHHRVLLNKLCHYSHQYHYIYLRRNCVCMHSVYTTLRLALLGFSKWRRNQPAVTIYNFDSAAAGTYIVTVCD